MLPHAPRHSQAARWREQARAPALRLAACFAAGLPLPVSLFTPASFLTAGRLAAGDLPGDLQAEQALGYASFLTPDS